MENKRHGQKHEIGDMAVISCSDLAKHSDFVDLIPCDPQRRVCDGAIRTPKFSSCSFKSHDSFEGWLICSLNSYLNLYLELGINRAACSQYAPIHGQYINTSLYIVFACSELLSFYGDCSISCICILFKTNASHFKVDPRINYLTPPITRIPK